MQLVIAAMSTEPCKPILAFLVVVSILTVFGGVLPRLAETVFVGRALQGGEEISRWRKVRQFDAVLRTFRAGDAVFTDDRVRSAEYSSLTELRHAPQAQGAVIIFVEFAIAVRATGGARQLAFLINREEAHRRAVFRAGCWRWSRDPRKCASRRACAEAP